jgi:O-6-methylguanine DNA methyltransferase
LSGTLRVRFIEVGGLPLAYADAGHGLCWLSLRGDREASLSALEHWRAKHAPGAEVVESHDLLPEVARQLEDYVAGRRECFDVALDERGTAFQRQVWAALRRIPFGRTVTYGELAEQLGRPGAARAVGTANGSNPIPIVTPCHRVVARDGLGGFAGGLELKRRLLGLEVRPRPSNFEGESE